MKNQSSANQQNKKIIKFATDFSTSQENLDSKTQKAVSKLFELEKNKIPKHTITNNNDVQRKLSKLKSQQSERNKTKHLRNKQSEISEKQFTEFIERQGIESVHVQEHDIMETMLSPKTFVDHKNSSKSFGDFMDFSQLDKMMSSSVFCLQNQSIQKIHPKLVDCLKVLKNFKTQNQQLREKLLLFKNQINKQLKNFKHNVINKFQEMLKNTENIIRSQFLEIRRKQLQQHKLQYEKQTQFKEDNQIKYLKLKVKQLQEQNMSITKKLSENATSKQSQQLQQMKQKQKNKYLTIMQNFSLEIEQFEKEINLIKQNQNDQEQKLKQWEEELEQKENYLNNEAQLIEEARFYLGQQEQILRKGQEQSVNKIQYKRNLKGKQVLIDDQPQYYPQKNNSPIYNLTEKKHKKQQQYQEQYFTEGYNHQKNYDEFVYTQPHGYGNQNYDGQINQDYQYLEASEDNYQDNEIQEYIEDQPRYNNNQIYSPKQYHHNSSNYKRQISILSNNPNPIINNYNSIPFSNGNSNGKRASHEKNRNHTLNKTSNFSQLGPQIRKSQPNSLNNQVSKSNNFQLNLRQRNYNQHPYAKNIRTQRSYNSGKKWTQSYQKPENARIYSHQKNKNNSNGKKNNWKAPPFQGHSIHHRQGYRRIDTNQSSQASMLNNRLKLIQQSMNEDLKKMGY